MAEAVQGVDFIFFVLFGRHKQRSARAEGDVAAAFAGHARTDRRRCVVARTRDYFDFGRQPEFLRNLPFKRTDNLVTFIKFRELPLGYTADFAHLPAPSPVLYVQQEHTARIRKIGAERAAQTVSEIIFGQHDFSDAGKVFRLVLLHPQNFGCGEPRKRDVARVCGQLIFADNFVEIRRLFFRPAVVPTSKLK